MAAAMVGSASAFFVDNFESASSAENYLISQTSTDSTVTFGFDYSTVGIESANGTGGTTRGLFMSVNDLGPFGSGTALEAAGIFTRQTWANDIVITFDMYMAYSGTAGTTEFVLAGVTRGNGFNVPTGGTPGSGPYTTGVTYAVSGEGGAARDYRTYEDGTERTGAAGGYQAAGASQDNGAALYGTIFPAGTNLPTGAPGRRWTKVKIEQIGGVSKWYLNDTLVVQFTKDQSGPFHATLGYMDIFSGAPTDAAGNFVVYDNLTVVPEPGTLAALGLGALALLKRKRAK